MENVFFSNDLIFLISGLVGLGLIGVFYFIFKSPKRTKVGAVAGDAAAQRQVPRRAVGNRNRMRGGTALGPRQGAREVENDEHVDETSSSAPVDLDDPKLGAKKRAKLEAKAEKKAQREAETKMREQRKVKQEKEDAERKLQEDMERAAEEKLEEEKRMAEEARKRKEEEEYLKMKSGFVIEEEGFDEEEEDEEGNLLQAFIDHIKEKKVVMLEDLAAKFRLKIQTVISRIEELLTSGALTGVIDDRGKFIYITNDELKAVADFIKKRGRVSIQELVENSNNLISLN